MKRSIFIVLAMILALTACKTTPNKYPTYQDALTNWTSYHDVANWLNSRFNYSYSRLSHGKKEKLVRKPKNLYEIRKGYCVDAAYFAKRSLNEINPEYKAELVWIENLQPDQNSHYATGFYDKGQLYVMDYGAGPYWAEAMHGVHGPYESLDQYRGFMSTLGIRNFTVGKVVWLDLPYTYNED